MQGPPYIVQNLVEGNQYEFRVYARNIMGLSEPSEMSQSVVCHTHDGEFEWKKNVHYQFRLEQYDLSSAMQYYPSATTELFGHKMCVPH